MPSGNLQRLGKSLSTRTELNDINDLLTFNFIALSQLPDTDLELAVLRKGLSMKLWTAFYTNYLTEDERQRMPKQIETCVPRYLFRKWDEFVLECAQQYGARLLLSELVLTRVWAWVSGGEESGSRKLKKLFDRMYHSSRIGLKQAKGAITDRHRRFKSIAGAELGILRERLRDDWPESAAQVRKHVDRIIETSPDLPNLRSNKEQLLKLLRDDKLALGFRGAAEKSKGDITPAQLLTKWVAGAENLSVEYARQRLLRKTARHGSKN
jgi:hypothetical protein